MGFSLEAERETELLALSGLRGTVRNGHGYLKVGVFSESPTVKTRHGRERDKKLAVPHGFPVVSDGGCLIASVGQVLANVVVNLEIQTQTWPSVDRLLGSELGYLSQLLTDNQSQREDRQTKQKPHPARTLAKTRRRAGQGHTSLPIL